MQNRLKAVSLLLFFLFQINGLDAQFVTGSAQFVTVTAYEFHGMNDSIYLFSADNQNKYIEVNSPNGLEASFEWLIYNPGSDSFQPLLTEDNVLSSRRNVDEDAGYRVIVTGNGNNDTAQFWTLINAFSVEIYNAEIIDDDGDSYKAIPESQKWCHLIRDINARIDSADLRYYDVNNGNPLKLQNIYTISWNADPQAGEAGINRFFRNDDFGLNIDIENPYWEDSWYYIIIEDSYGFTARDSVFYESIEPHADFRYDYITLDNRFHYPGHSEQYYIDYYNSSNYQSVSAPALFSFENLSVNADTLIWFFGDGASEIAGADSLLHTYDLPGSYSPKLIVYNIVSHLYEACADTFPKYNEEVDFGDTGYPIVVDEASLNYEEAQGLFNAITVPPDGFNDYFRFIGDVSLTDFEIVIYNRYGHKVYKFEGNIRDWEGWDGTYNNSGKYVNTGVYYYVVKELGVLPSDEYGRKPKLIVAEDPTAEVQINNVYRGFLHVFNAE